MKGWNAFVDFLDDIKVGAIATVDGSKPNVRAMAFVSLGEECTIFTTTSPSTRKIREMVKNPNVCVFFWKEHRSFRVHGKAEIVNDINTKSKVLEKNPGWKEHYPLGPSDPNFSLIKININELEGD